MRPPGDPPEPSPDAGSTPVVAGAGAALDVPGVVPTGVVEPAVRAAVGVGPGVGVRLRPTVPGAPGPLGLLPVLAGVPSAGAPARGGAVVAIGRLEVGGGRGTVVVRGGVVRGGGQIARNGTLAGCLLAPSW
jgi:hypothetical protein